MTHRTLTEEQSEKLARLLIMMEVPKEMCLDILTVVETNEELLTFLDKLSAKNYDMTPEEVYQAMVFAEDEDDALNQLEEQLKEQGIAHGMCMAEEV